MNQKPWHTASFYDYGNHFMYTDRPCGKHSTIDPASGNPPMHYIADIPISLAKSIEGKYFVGSAENLKFGNATNAWARLYNPIDSGVNFFLNVWTATDLSSSPFRVQIWFNATPPGIIQVSPLVSPANTAYFPSPTPHVRLEYAVGAIGLPEGGIMAFCRNEQAGTTINSEEQGKFIFPPGGSFLVFISNPETPVMPAIGKIAFGWWEEPICNMP